MKNISLNGIWELRGGSGERGGVGRAPYFEQGERFMKTEVPSSVQESLIKSGIIGEPTLGKNVLSARWVEEFIWSYRRTFILTAEDIAEKVRITFAQLDLTAAIYINGIYVGAHNNFYCPARFDITALVHEGENTVFVKIDSGLFYAGDKPALPYYGSFVPGTRLHKRMWLRKPQCSFEWDWSPRLINVGISGDVTIECGEVFVNETSVLATVSDDYANAEIEYRVFAENLTNTAKELTLKLMVSETGDTATVPVTAAPGANRFTAKIGIKTPKLWNPAGYGGQHRYNVTAELTGSGAVIFEKTQKVGLRKVVIDQSAHPVKGTYYILTVNGNRVFVKGGNFVPADIVYSRIRRADYAVLIDRALEANCNAMRVWGGGLYESDDFYDLCDERGVIVWQDCIGACSNYPSTDLEYFANFTAEITYQIRRLSMYASLCILSGNNEIEWQTWDMPYGQRYPDANIYHWLIPRTLAAENPYIYYQPSSPWSPNFEYPNADHTGDQHPWNIGFADNNFFGYRTYECRFPNEGGVRGPNSLPAAMACLDPGEEYMHSLSWQIHENSIDDHSMTSTADYIVSSFTGVDSLKIPIADYIYLGGFLQGEGLSEYILNFRRRKFDCASAIFWMYNDCWPATRSWTIVDYYKNRTPSFYPVRRAFAPQACDVVKEDGRFAVYVISDSLSDAAGELEYGIFTADGKYLSKETKKITIVRNASNICAYIDAAAYDSKTMFPYAILRSGGEIISQRRFVEVIYKDLPLEAPEIKVKSENGEKTLISDVFVMGVCTGLDGTSPDDNFFDLFPGLPRKISAEKEIIYTLNGMIR